MEHKNVQTHFGNRKHKNAKMVGICSLILSVLEGYTVEDAIDVIETGKKPEGKHRFNSRRNVIDMIIMREKENMTYDEISKIYDIDRSTIYRKIERKGI